MIKRSYPFFILMTLTSMAVLSSTTIAAQKIEEWKSNEIIKPAQLIKLLSGKSAEKPLVLQVGFDFLYEGGHIDGSIHAGPASRPDGIQSLKNAVKNVPKNKPIVIYCGCCPWVECPNIRPAFATLQSLGFRNVKALFLPVNFEHDWISKGYPTSKGSKPVSK